MDFQNIVAGCGLVWLLIWVGHWFPWARILGREMHRLEAYTYGTGGIYLGLLLICFLFQDFTAARWTAWVMISAGAATFSAWGIDWLGLKIATSRRRTRKDERLAETE